MVGNVLLTLLVSRLLIFCWQLTGLLRAIEQDFLSNRNILKTRALQGVSLIIVLFTLVYSLELIQSTVHFKQALKIHAQPGTSRAYQLTLDNKQLIIRGDLEIGITQTARTLIKGRQEISSVVLESQGGHIYEGRGLARLFIENQLDTYVYQQCSSACTTAFIGGRNRLLGAGGKLGFHQYKLDRSQYRPGLLPFYDLGAEQQRDQALFLTRGVDPGFVKKMFEQAPNKIWFPPTDVAVISERCACS